MLKLLLAGIFLYVYFSALGFAWGIGLALLGLLISAVNGK